MPTQLPDSIVETKKYLWVTDPWDTLAHSQDTTLRLMQEALSMGISTYWSSSEILFSSVSDQSLKVIEIQSFPFTPGLAPHHWVELPTSNFQHIHYRVDPPVDVNYISVLDGILKKGATEEQILNPPQVLKQQSEKVPPHDLQKFAPKFCTVLHASEATHAQTLFQGHEFIVTKPMNLAQSIGVKKWPAPQTLEEWQKLITAETENETKSMLIEEYLPQVNEGEVRMWFANGHFIAALKKYPKKGDFRVLIDEGSKIEAYTLTASEQEVAKQVGSVLKKTRVALAAIDFIGGKLCDYNITSPGLLIQLEEVHGKNFAREILRVIC